jgi:hypothetical protein
VKNCAAVDGVLPLARGQCPEDHGSGLLNGFHALAQKIGDPDLAVRRASRPELPLSEMACLRQLATRAFCPKRMAAGREGKEKQKKARTWTSVVVNYITI